MQAESYIVYEQTPVSRRWGATYQPDVCVVRVWVERQQLPQTMHHTSVLCVLRIVRC